MLIILPKYLFNEYFFVFISPQNSYNPASRPAWGAAVGPQQNRNMHNECRICGETGHFQKDCPSSQKDKETKIKGVPVSAFQKPTDASTGLPNTSEYQRIKNQRGEIISASNIDLSKAPPHLRCPFSGRLLEDAVTLTCCSVAVSDCAIRAELLASNLKCPQCGRTDVSPDDLRPQMQLRKAVEEYLAVLHRSADGKGTESKSIPAQQGSVEAPTSEGNSDSAGSGTAPPPLTQGNQAGAAGGSQGGRPSNMRENSGGENEFEFSGGREFSEGGFAGGFDGGFDGGFEGGFEGGFPPDGRGGFPGGPVGGPPFFPPGNMYVPPGVPFLHPGGLIMPRPSRPFFPPAVPIPPIAPIGVDLGFHPPAPPTNPHDGFPWLMLPAEMQILFPKPLSHAAFIREQHAQRAYKNRMHEEHRKETVAIANAKRSTKHPHHHHHHHHQQHQHQHQHQLQHFQNNFHHNQFQPNQMPRLGQGQGFGFGPGPGRDQFRMGGGGMSGGLPSGGGGAGREQMGNRDAQHDRRSEGKSVSTKLVVN